MGGQDVRVEDLVQISLTITNRSLENNSWQPANMVRASSPHLGHALEVESHLDQAV